MYFFNCIIDLLFLKVYTNNERIEKRIKTNSLTPLEAYLFREKLVIEGNRLLLSELLTGLIFAK